jgi:hypothetical protein
MPDRQNWTAAMVLERVLSRDMQAVLAIAADHGAVEVDTVAKKVTEIRPASMRDVERTHAIDESISDQGEKIARAIVWGDLKGIPARREIYDALKLKLTLSSSAVLARSMSSRIISGEASRAS